MWSVASSLLVGTTLFLISAPLWRRIAARDGDWRVARLMRMGLLLKLLAAPLFILVIDQYYGGVADLRRYHLGGSEIAAAFRSGDLLPHVDRIVGPGSVELVTGVVYAVLGASEVVGSIVFSWLAFFGLYAFFRAFETAMPDGDRIRYALLLFLLPTTLIWTSIIGKDALVVLGLGLGAWGGAKLIRRERRAFLLLISGLAVASLVRPHMALFLLGAVGVALLLARAPRSTPTAPLIKVGAIAVLGLGLLVISGEVADYLGVESLDAESIDAVIDETSEQTRGDGPTETRGGFDSSFDSGPRTVARYPWIATTVLFRPFPWEAHNAAALLSSAESMFLLALLLAALPKIGRFASHIRRQPYVALALSYVLVVSYAFASFSNFGLLARQRVQLLPLFLVLLALPRQHQATTTPEPAPAPLWTSRP